MVWYDKQWENPLYWFDILLKYSPHATERTIERDLPFVDFLPLDAKYVSHIYKKDTVSLLFEINVNYKPMYISLDPYGLVFTVYPKIETRASEFQYKYNRYLGAFKPPVDYLPTITLDDFGSEGFEGAL
jgi:hypothetical protein